MVITLNDNILIHIGKRIKLYRTMKKISIEDLSKLIHKSKATVSKYENGKISADISTLFDIARALSVDLNQLIDYNSFYLNKDVIIMSNPFKDIDLLYLYFYDGRTKKICVSVIELFLNNSTKKIQATLFENVYSYKNYNKCEYLYNGFLKCFENVIYFTFESQNNSIAIENIIIYSMINPLKEFNLNSALFTGLSINPLFPMSLKAIISKEPLLEIDKLHDLLVLTKDELKKIKKLNMFTIDHMDKDFETELLITSFDANKKV